MQLEQVALYEGKRNASEHRGIHEFLEILVQKLKNQVEFVFCVNDIQQFDNIRVIKLLKPRDLSYGNWVHPLSLSVQADSFKRHHFSRQLVFGFVHNSVRALSDLFHFLEVLHEALASRVSPALERGPGNPAENGTQLSGAEEGNRAQHRDPRSGWNAVYLPLLSICPT